MPYSDKDSPGHPDNVWRQAAEDLARSSGELQAAREALLRGLEADDIAEARKALNALVDQTADSHAQYQAREQAAWEARAAAVAERRR